MPYIEHMTRPQITNTNIRGDVDDDDDIDATLLRDDIGNCMVVTMV